MGKLRNPKPPPKTFQFKSNWKTGAANKRVSLPPAIAPSIMDIARCIDRNPAIAKQVLEFAQSLLAE